MLSVQYSKDNLIIRILVDFLLIKQEHTQPASNITQLVINKDDVSAIYSETPLGSKEQNLMTPGTLVLSMKSGKEFRFKYESHLNATIWSIALVEAIRAKSAVEITI
jgi:hypothetical protein